MAGDSFEIKGTIGLDLDASNIGQQAQQVAKQATNALSKIKMPEKLDSGFKNNFRNIDTLVDDIQKKMKEGFKTKADATDFKKSLKNLEKEWDKFTKNMSDASKIELDYSKIYPDQKTLDRIKELRAEIEKIQSNSNKSINTSGLQGVPSQLPENARAAQASYEQFINTLNSYDGSNWDEVEDAFSQFLTTYNRSRAAFSSKEDFNNLRTNIVGAFDAARDSVSETENQVQKLENEITNVKADAVKEAGENFKEVNGDVKEVNETIGKTTIEMGNAAVATADFNTEVKSIGDRVKAFFSLTNGVQLFKRAVREAYQAVSELDQSMTATAVVSDETVSSMWEKLPQYAESAKNLGTTMNDVVNAQALYVQQGLNMEDSMGLATETMKMARVAAIDAETATNAMTAALHGFNMELNETSAQRINDVYSKLAQNTASNTKEISTAMSKVASIANSAGMEFETTSAFLAQIIETTRESAETA